MAKKQQPKPSTEDLRLEEVSDAPKNLDPHLVQIILAEKTNLPTEPVALREGDSGMTEVDVIAKLADPDQEVPGLTIIQKIAAAVANVCVALCSGLMDAVIGQVIVVDEGWSLVSPLAYLTGEGLPDAFP